MPLEISVIDMKKEDKANDKETWGYDPFTVYVGDHRILTIHTEDYLITNKWLNDVEKSPPNNHKHGCILVGVCAEHDPDEIYRRSINKDLEVVPYHLLKICIGSHCYLYSLEDPNSYHTPKALQTFFANPRVIAVGMKMKSLAKKLETDHGIKFVNPVDLNELAEKGMKRHDLDLGRYDLDRLAKAVLGKHWDVERPEEEYIPWFNSIWTGRWWNKEFSAKKALEATVDPFLCFMIGNELLDLMDDSWYPMEFKQFVKMNKKYKKKKGKDKKNFRSLIN